jgi:site-specific DNA-cytosine methylase
MRDSGIGMSLVYWSISLAELLKAKGIIKTWSLEQVAATAMKELMPKHGGRVLKLDQLGVPQTRRRAILGNIDLGSISEYEEAPRTLQQLMDSLGIAAPDGFDCTTAGHGLKKRLPCGKESYSCRQFTQVCSTVLSSHPSFYSTAQARSTAFPLILAAEAQVFPRDYIFPASYGNKNLRLMVANAVSPRLSKILIELAARTVV